MDNVILCSTQYAPSVWQSVGSCSVHAELKFLQFTSVWHAAAGIPQCCWYVQTPHTTLYANHIERTNKMQPFSGIYYYNVS
jgi:hypothetical protein